MKVYNVIMTDNNGGCSVSSCLGSFLYENAAGVCLQNEIEKYKKEYKNVKVWECENSYRVEYGGNDVAILHIEKTDLTTNFDEPFDNSYVGAVEYIKKRIYNELFFATMSRGIDEVRDDGDYATIYFGKDKIKYLGNIFIKWVSKYIDERNNEFIIVGLSDGKRLSFTELPFEQQLAIGDFITINYKKL